MSGPGTLRKATSGALLALLLSLPAAAAGDALVRDLQTGQRLYRMQVLQLRASGRVQSEERSFLAPDGHLLARQRLDLGESPIQPQLEYREPDGLSWQLQRRERGWRLSQRAHDQAREHKQWPELVEGVVIDVVLPRYLAAMREAILREELVRLSVFDTRLFRVRRYGLRAKTYATSRGRVVRVELLRKRLFGRDEVAGSVEILADDGEPLVYRGPTLCLCGGQQDRLVEIDYMPDLRFR